MIAPGGDAAHPVEDARVVRTRNDVSRAALHVLTEQGWDAVTHAHLARTAGYSRATLYKHWPTRTDLITSTIVVIIFVAIMIAIVAGLDLGLAKVVVWAFG